MSEDLVAGIEKLLKDALAETGRTLKSSAEKLAKDTADLAKNVARLRGDPDFDKALDAAKRITLIRAGLAAIDEADALDARLRATLLTALDIGTRLLI